MTDPQSSAEQPLARVRRQWRYLSLATLGERTWIINVGEAGKTPLLTVAWSRWRLAADSPRLRQRRLGGRRPSG